MRTLTTLLLALPVWGAAQGSSTAEQLSACLKANRPPSLAARLQVETREPGAAPLLRESLYATQTRERPPGASDHWVGHLAPETVAGVVHLYRQRDPGWERFSWLPALSRVSRVQGEGEAVPALEDVVGLRDFDTLLRWPTEALMSFSEAREQDGLRTRLARGTRPVGSGEGRGFERLEALIDVDRCVLLEAEWTAADGLKRRRITVDRSTLRRYDRYWLPARFTVRETPGGETRVQVLALRVAAPPPAVFDPRQFHRVGPAELRLNGPP